MKGFVREVGSSFVACWWSKDPGTGKRRQHSKSFSKESEAKKHLAIMVGKVTEGIYKPDRPLSVRELLEDRWLPTKRAQNKRPATLSQYELAVKSYILPAVGAVKVAALTEGNVNEMVATMERNGLSARTRQVAVATLKAATRWALANGYVGRDPLAAYARPQLQRSEVASWSPDQARHFLSYVKGDRLEAVWALALLRGLRRGELAGLKWSDIDLDRGDLRVVRARVSVDGKAIESDVKTSSGRRTVPLDGHLLALLRAHWAHQAEEKLAAGRGAYQDGGYLVANELGRPMHPDALSHRFKVLVRRASLPETHLHTLRHTCASLLLADGVNARVIQEMLGHSDVRITLSLYSHVAPSMGREAGAALSASLLS